MKTTTESVDYIIETDNGPRTIHITPVNKTLPNGDHYATGVFRLHEGTVGLGEIKFDELSDDWDYDGVGDLSNKQVLEIVRYILKNLYEDN